MSKYLAGIGLGCHTAGTQVTYTSINVATLRAFSGSVETKQFSFQTREGPLLAKVHGSPSMWRIFNGDKAIPLQQGEKQILAGL